MLARKFEEQVLRTPENIAIKSGDQSITYRQLNQAANRAAYRILEKCNPAVRLSEQERIRYRRQMLIEGWGIESQEKLQQVTVFVAGAGGSGSPLIMQLALCGVGNIIVSDFDSVELSNLNRQCLHDESRLGINKALSAQMSIEKLNPGVKVIARTERITRENVDELVADALIIFDNVDDLETKFILSECAVRKDIPHVISSMIDINSYAAIFYPPYSPCFHCLYDRHKLEEIAAIKALVPDYEKAPNPVASPSLFLSTGFIVNESLKIILGFATPAYNKYFLFNQRGSAEVSSFDGHMIITYPFSEHFRRECKAQGFDWNEAWRGKFLEELDVTSDPDCPLCGKGAKRPKREDNANENHSDGKPVRGGVCAQDQALTAGGVFTLGNATTAGSVSTSGDATTTGGAFATRNESEVSAGQSNTRNPDVPPTVIALLFEHGTDMITGLLGAVKAGKTYVPLDPAYPLKRLTAMLEDSGACLLVTNAQNKTLATRLLNRVKNYIKLLVLDSFTSETHIHTSASTSLGTSIVTSADTCTVSAQNPSKDVMDTATENPGLQIEGNDLAYILYTSGSTGKPKGVMQTYENIYYFATSYAREFGLTSKDHLTLFSAFGHDAAVIDIYSGLLSGATLYPVNIKDQVKLNELASWLKNEQITVYHSVPTVYRYFLKNLEGGESFPDLRWIILGGEEVIEHDIAMFKKYFSAQTTFVNLYGQSESSFNSAFKISMDTAIKRVTLGEPIEGTEIFVVDEEGGEVSPLEIGEILVAGYHVAPGYWQDAEKTAQAFGADSELGRIYFTGDLGRLLLDGSIEFMGRKDFQVKIRGYRVEFGEIETALLTHPQIEAAVVLAKEDAIGEKSLWAYLVTTGNKTTDANTDQIGEDELRTYLLANLPDYMVPSFFIFLEKLPLTGTNKVDRKALQEMNPTAQTAAHYIAPTDEIEVGMVQIWTEVLGLEGIGIEDNFFALGGHSLKATALILKVNKKWNVDIPLRQIFLTPTVKALANYVRTAQSEATMTEVAAGDGVTTAELAQLRMITRESEREYYPVSSGQKRLYLLNQLAPESTGYNMPRIMQVSGNIDPARLAAAFQALVNRHAILRTAFVAQAGEIVQKVLPQVDFAMAYQEISPAEAEKHMAGFVRPFDLTQAPLLRVTLLKLCAGYGKDNHTTDTNTTDNHTTDTHTTNTNITDTHTTDTHILPTAAAGTQAIHRYTLMFDMHHIISDGISMNIFIRDLICLYDGRALPELPYQYADYAVWQNNLFQSGLIHQQETYWLNKLAGLTYTNLPKKNQLQATEKVTGERQISFEPVLTGQLDAFCQANGMTRFTVLLACFKVILSKKIKLQDLAIGIPIAGRNAYGLDNLIGLFLNLLVIRTQLDGEQTFRQYLETIQETVMGAYENQDYPYEELFASMKRVHKYSGDALFSILFNYLPLQNREIHSLAGITIEAQTVDDIEGKYDLTLYALETSERLYFKAVYQAGLYEDYLIEQMLDELPRLTELVLANPDILLKAINFGTEEELENFDDYFEDIF